MSRTVTDVPFAVGSDGCIYINLTHWKRARPRALVERALGQHGEVLVAVRASSPEARRNLQRLRDGASEAVAFAIAARERQLRKRDTIRRPHSSGRRSQ